VRDETATAARPPVLVVGVGSELRSDDAVGRRIADRLATRLPPDEVEVRSVHQLTPELADDAVGRRLVVVVDAAVDVRTVTVRQVTADGTPTALSHRLDAGALLRLAGLLGSPPADVVTVAVPARRLEIGTELSAAAERDVDLAVDHVAALCRPPRGRDDGSRRAGEHAGEHDAGTRPVPAPRTSLTSPLDEEQP
jgi:hydrogenase maturation protease